MTNHTEKNVETVVSTVSENKISDTEYHGVRVIHHGFPNDSIVQNITTYAYKLGGYDFLAVLECENGKYQLNAIGDKGHAFGLCQINDLYHKDIPQNYTTDWVVAVEYCYSKRKNGTIFYGPKRLIKGVKCYEYVKDRFTFIE